MNATTKLKSKGLGRGLEALLGEAKPDLGLPAAQDSQPPRTLPLSQLQPGRYQPRGRMDESALQELADSIRQHGLMQPIVVRSLQQSTSGSAHSRLQPYEIIAGERRFRAASLAGLSEVPVLVRQVEDEQALALALIENIQREDLNPMEEARAIRRLIDEFQYTHERAAEAIGRSRSATSNLLRLLNLAESVQTMLLAGDLEMGHARALLALDRASQIMVANEVVQRRLSVREAEARVANQLKQAAHPAGTTAARQPDDSHGHSGGIGASGGGGREGMDPDLRRLTERLSDALGAAVQLQANRRGGGKLVIGFSSHEQFEGLLSRLGLGSDEF